jgi:hypothetical protein
VLFRALTLLSFFVAQSAGSATPAAITTTALEAQIGTDLARVEPFREIRKLAQKIGVRVWLFGGTASSFAHYVKRDELRKHGDTRYQPDRFDFHYTSIYHSSQDLDIAVDGTEEQIKTLEAALKKSHSYFEGSKDRWEVRSLRQRRGDKDALLDDFNFQNQHTDSHSTGMIELTEPGPGEARVRDLRDWKPAKGTAPQFLRDVADGKLHFYFSPTHGDTRLASEGNNPPILSVIRYFTKAFKEELEIRPEDEAVLKKLISEFDPKQNYRVTSWIEKNAKKLFQHAVNIEYAAQVLDRVGLRKKLISLGDPEKKDTLAWWLNRKPLASAEVGKGPRIDPKRPPDKTAAELGITEVSHETRSFLAYESITRAHTGDANVLTSRENAAGEVAALGEGFYTLKGDRGAVGTGITIHFQVDPQARENIDFKRDGDILIFRNKAALRVIPESLNVAPFKALDLLSGEEFDPRRDRAILEMLKRRLGTDARTVSEKDLPRLTAWVQSQLQSKKLPIDALSLAFASPALLSHPELAEALLEKDPSAFISTVLVHDQWLKQPQAESWLKKIVPEKDLLKEVADQVLSKQIWKTLPHAPAVERAIIQSWKEDTYGFKQFFDIELSQPITRYLVEDPRGVEALLPLNYHALTEPMEAIISKIPWDRPEEKKEVMRLILKKLGDEENPFLNSLKYEAGDALFKHAVSSFRDGKPLEAIDRNVIQAVGKITFRGKAFQEGAPNLSIGMAKQLAELEVYDEALLEQLARPQWAKNPEIRAIIERILTRTQGHWRTDVFAGGPMFSLIGS